MKTRIKIALFFILASFAFSGILGLGFGAIIVKDGESFWTAWLNSSELLYVLLFAGMTAGGALILLLPIDEILALIFGIALYYGTIFLGGTIRDIMDSQSPFAYIIAFVIVSLVCYSIWQGKQNKR